MSKKFRLVVAIGLILLMVLSACERSASTVTLATPTATSKFPYPFPTADNPMSMLQQYATQTAAAGGNPTLQPVTTTPGTPSSTEVTPTGPTATLSNLPTGTATVAFTKIPAATPGLPTKYTLQPGEFVYCIARRFNLNPAELSSLNGLSDLQNVQPGTVLKIPQTGNHFPSARALHAHPATYTVATNDTIYSIACYYGDVDPLVIANANNLSAPYKLKTGQILNIP